MDFEQSQTTLKWTIFLIVENMNASIVVMNYDLWLRTQ